MQEHLKIRGEYDIVARFTDFHDLLKRYHITPMTKEEALKVTEILCQKHNISFKRMKINWREKGRAYGGIKKAKGKRIGYMSLPTTPYDPIKDIVNGHLTVGTVLHEFAHVIVHSRRIPMNGQPHGRIFTEILDRLLIYYNQNIEDNIKVMCDEPIVGELLGKKWVSNGCSPAGSLNYIKNGGSDNYEGGGKELFINKHSNPEEVLITMISKDGVVARTSSRGMYSYKPW